MTFYRDRIYPRLVRALGNPEPIRRIRETVVKRAQGTVLEIGVGPGVNFVHYDPTRTTKIFALEPNPGMRRLAQQERLRTPIDVTFLDLPGESIPLENSAVDTVLSTFTMCTIPGVSAAVKEMRPRAGPWDSTLAAADGAHHPLALRGLPCHARYSLDHRRRRLPDRRRREGIPGTVPQIVDLHLVGLGPPRRVILRPLPHPRRKLRRSALMVSASVEGMPCGKPL